MLLAFFWKWKIVTKLHCIITILFFSWWFLQYKEYSKKAAQQFTFDLRKPGGVNISFVKLFKFDYHYAVIQSLRNSEMSLSMSIDDLNKLLKIAGRAELLEENKEVLSYYAEKKK